MIALFSPHPGHHGRSRRAGRDEPAAIPEKASPSLADGAPGPLPAPVPEASPQEPGAGAPSLSWRTSLAEAEAAVTAASRELDGGQEQAVPDPDGRWPAVVTDGDGEPLPRRVPGASLPRVPEPGSIADRLNGYLASAEPADAEQARHLIEALRAMPADAPLTAAPRALPPAPVMPARAVREPEREPERGPVPGAAVLLGIGGETRKRMAVAPLDGMPERRTFNGGQPVIHLGDDPRHPGEAFAIVDMSDAWLDALITAALDERGTRRAARDGDAAQQATAVMPTFTPREQDGVDL